MRRECPSDTHEAIRRFIDASCTRGTPNPPPGLSPSPRPPPPPRAPPPLAGSLGQLRLKSAEVPTSPDCRPVTYEACRKASIEVGTALGVSTNLDISLAPCEENVNLGACFIGCTLGSSSGHPSLYMYLTQDQIERFGNYNSWRCAAAAHDYCLCAADSPSPPPPPHIEDETVFQYAGTGLPIDYSGHPSAFYKKVGTDIAMPADFRTEVTSYDCVGDDTGANQCARHCSAELGDHLVAFSVTGHMAPPPPPGEPEPLPPPLPPPSPLPPWGFQFNGATDGCLIGGIYTGGECRDGGVNSLFPPCDTELEHVAELSHCHSTSPDLSSPQVL